MTAGKKRELEDMDAGPSPDIRKMREAAENKLKDSPGTAPDLAGQTHEQLIHELLVHQIELETQAEELRMAHHELTLARDKYLDLYEFAPVGYFTLSDKALIKEVNLTGATLFGADRNKLLNERFRKFIAEKDSEPWVRYFMNLLVSGEKQVCSLTLLRNDRGAFHAWLEGIRITSNDGAATVRIAITDISDIRQAEEALRESDTRYRNIITNTPVGYFRIDTEGRFQEVNDAWLRMHGFSSKDEVIGMHFSLAHINADQEQAQDLVDHVIHGGQISRGEFSRLMKDGSVAYHTFSAVPVIKDDKIAGLDGFLFDITDRKRAEDALRESEAYLRAILDATPFPIALVDISDNNIEYWSRSALTLFGHTAPSAPEWYQIAYPDPDYRADVIARWKPYLEKAKISGETVNTGEYRVTCRDGSVRICELYASFLPDKLIVTFNDITERKRAEEALRESEETFKALAENANDGILVAVTEEAHTYANRRVSEMLGYSVAELQKSSIKDLVAPDVAATLIGRFRKRLSGEDTPQQYETSLLHKDGKIVPVEISAAKTSWHGQPADLVIIHDITGRKRTEETIQKAFAERGVLLREIHHRVKNNLASIISLIGLQVASLTDPTTISLLRDLETRIRSMALVHESLYISEDLARINFGNYTEKLVRHLFDIYMTGEKIQCRIDTGDITMPIETAIPCGLVITEIITNSMKYAFPKTFSCNEIRGEVCSITLTMRREGSNYLLNIADNGIGIPEKTDATPSRSLGLYLIKLIVQYQLRGNLEICTEKGTSYTIRFPDPMVNEWDDQ